METERRQFATWRNSEKAYSPFSKEEMRRRQMTMRAHMAATESDACLFTSHHNICYFSGVLYCAFGRRHAFVPTPETTTIVSPAIDGGQPWRRSFTNDNLTYTDWRRENYFSALQERLGGVRRFGIEFDHVSLEMRQLLEATFPAKELINVAQAAMRLRTIKSEREHALIHEGVEYAAPAATPALPPSGPAPMIVGATG